jgi:hypothetical protein
MSAVRWLAGAVALGAACLDPDSASPRLTADDRLTLEVLRGASPSPTDPARVTGAFVSGKGLVIDLQYSGGCRTHRFGIFTDGLEGLSIPPFVNLFLVHDAGGDACEAALTRRLRVNLGPLDGVLRPGIDFVLQLVEPDGRPADVPGVPYRL